MTLEDYLSYVVDPIAQKVTLLEWVDSLHEEQVYEDN